MLLDLSVILLTRPLFLEPLDGFRRSDMLRLIQLFGEILPACALSKKWKLRECAMAVGKKHLKKLQLEAEDSDYDSRSTKGNDRLNVGCELAAIGLEDKLPLVFTGACELTRRLLGAEFLQDEVSKMA